MASPDGNRDDDDVDVDDDDEAMISFADDDFADDFADLFSFATAPSESPSPSKHAMDYGNALASSSGIPLPPNQGNNGTADDYNDGDNESTHSDDSFLELLEQQKDPATLVHPIKPITEAELEAELEAGAEIDTDTDQTATTTATTSDKAPPTPTDANATMQEILDWLDDDDDTVSARQTEEEGTIVFVRPDQRPPTLEESLAAMKTGEVPPAPVPAPAPPTFDTLEQAVKSPHSTLSQIRTLLSKEGLTVSASIRPHLWCKVVGGKTLEDTLQSSVADSFQQWEQHYLERELQSKSGVSPATQVAANDSDSKDDDSSKEEKSKEEPMTVSDDDNKAATATATSAAAAAAASLIKYQHAQKEWIQQQSATLADRIVLVLKGDKTKSQQALTSLLMNHYQSQGPTAESDDEEDIDKPPSIPNYQDPLLPPVACAILSAGVPKAAASVLLSQIVPHCMPLLALTLKERNHAASLLHRQLYLLGYYHLPLLALHLDRYLPDWYNWPAGGFIPQSYLISHLAGECTTLADAHDPSSAKLPSVMMNPRWVLALWDLILTSTNNSLRFFLVLAVLESHADQLLLLTGQPLREKLQEVMNFQQEDETGQFAIESEDQTSTQDATKWVLEWTDKAQALWEQTPVSVTKRLRYLEDQTVADMLTRRQQAAEVRFQRKLEAERQAYQAALETERERKADEARLRLTRARLVAFYRQYNPENESNIDKIMETYKGRYESLDGKLKKKYGVSFNPAMRPKTPAFSRPKVPGFGNGGINKKPSKADVAAKQEKQLVEQRKRQQVVLKVAPVEVLPMMCWSKEANQVRMSKIEKGNKLEDNEEGRLPLKFYMVDSRPSETAQDQGRFPTSVSLTPEDLMDPDRMKQQEDMLESLRGAVHIVIMGEGFAALPKLYGSKMTNGLAECIREDDSRNSNCALFFLKKGFPFVSVLDGGFAAAHAFLYREGKKHQLRVHDVLADYNAEVSIFGQFERVHTSTGREKAQRAFQNIFDSSIVALTKNSKRFETLASEIGAGEERQQSQNKKGNMMARFFAGGGGNEENRKETSKEPKESSMEPAATPKVPVPSGNKPVFRNPFVRKSLERKLERENSSNSIDVESVDDLDVDSSHVATDSKPAPPKTIVPKQTATNSFTVQTQSTPAAQRQGNTEVAPAKPSDQRKASDQPKANPFSGLGAAFNNSLKAASKVAAGDGSNPANKGRGRNPFARFNVGNTNLGASQHGGKALGISHHGGKTLGASQHGAKADNQGPGIGMARNMAGFKEFRKNAMARIRVNDDPSQEESKESTTNANADVQDESVSFDQNSPAIAPERKPQHEVKPNDEAPDVSTIGDLMVGGGELAIEEIASTAADSTTNSTRAVDSVEPLHNKDVDAQNKISDEQHMTDKEESEAPKDPSIERVQ